MTEKTNTFEELEKTKKQEAPEEQTSNTEISQGSEMNLDEFDDVAIGDRKKYVREPLDGQEVEVEKLQIFKGDTSTTPKASMSGNSRYWDCTIIVTYNKKNADGVNHREYLSGARQFENKDGTASNINFWYEGSKNQVAGLWEKVAAKKGIEPKELSPREFVAFMNNKPKVKIVGEKFQFPGSPAVTKNMIGEFL